MPRRVVWMTGREGAVDLAVMRFRGDVRLLRGQGGHLPDRRYRTTLGHPAGHFEQDLMSAERNGLLVPDGFSFGSVRILVVKCLTSPC